MEAHRPPEQELSGGSPRWLRDLMIALTPAAAFIGAVAALITAVRS
jgi:hypothetical protein